ncbi:RNA 2',3'-cyclic phosphodiesterase [Candidatus Omnitrophota bacterium]
MNLIRAFIAVEIDLSNKEKLSKLISQLKKSNADIKWLSENQMHFTLKFLGNIEENKVSLISDTLRSIAAQVHEFTLTLSNIGAFPNMRKPRVIWIGVDKGAEDLKLLAAKIEKGLEKLGLEQEKRDYKAHLTLGRVRSSKNISNLTDIVHKIKPDLKDGAKIKKVILFKSVLTGKGAIYTPLSELNLRISCV